MGLFFDQKWAQQILSGPVFLVGVVRN